MSVPRIRRRKSINIDKVKRRKSISISRHEDKVINSIRRLSSSGRASESSISRQKRKKKKSINSIPEENTERGVFEKSYDYAREVVVSERYQQGLEAFFSLFISDFRLIDDLISIFSGISIFFIFLYYFVGLTGLELFSFAYLESLFNSDTSKTKRKKKKTKRKSISRRLSKLKRKKKTKYK